MAERVMAHPKIEMVWDSEIISYRGVDKLEGLTLRNRKTNEERDVDAGGLFIAIGHSPNTESLRGTNVKLDEEGYIVVQNNVYTNIDGVFAAGDCHDKIFRQAITASGFGCMAAITAERWLDAKEKN